MLFQDQENMLIHERVLEKSQGPARDVLYGFVVNVFFMFMLTGMEVLNRAIESIIHSRDRDEWEPIVIHVSDKFLSLWRGEVRVYTT